MSAPLVAVEVAQERSRSNTTPNAPRPSYFHALELNTMKALGQRFALAYRLSAHGARIATAEAGQLTEAGEVKVVYSAEATARGAHEEKSAYGSLLELQPLFNARNEDASSALCQRCLFPASDVGPLVPYAVRTKHGRIALNLCDECITADQTTEAAVAQKQSNVSRWPDVTRLFGGAREP